MRPVRFLVAAGVAAILALSAQTASAKLLIAIDKSAQRMIVSEDGAQLYVWPVSTGISRYDTPGGSYTPFRMERDHFSREWDNAPMPNSIFFTARGHAIHGTTHASIGRPASHGCVRLSVANSLVLFDLVRREGMANTRVVLFGEIPSGAPEMVRRAPDASPYRGVPAVRRYDSDQDVVGSVPQSGALPDRTGARERYTNGQRYYGAAPTYDDDDSSYRRLPPPFFFPGPRPF